MYATIIQLNKWDNSNGTNEIMPEAFVGASLPVIQMGPMKLCLKHPLERMGQIKLCHNLSVFQMGQINLCHNHPIEQVGQLKWDQ
eukprot:9983391-Karenia_brevis.AAC.1